MQTIDAQAFLEAVTAEMLRIPMVYEEVDAGAGPVRWIHDKIQNIDWIFAPADHVTPDELRTFADDSLAQAVEHRQKARETLTNRPGMVCPVVVTTGADADMVARIRASEPQRRTAATWGRFIFPVVVDLTASSVAFPERLPRRLSVGGVPARSLSKQARKTVEKVLAPAA